VPGQNWGAMTWQVLFLYLGGRISMAQVSDDLDFWSFGTFNGISQKGITVRGKSRRKKNLEKTPLQEHNYFQKFLLKRFLSCKHSKKPGHI
jgi:hypothetical protein